MQLLDYSYYMTKAKIIEFLEIKLKNELEEITKIAAQTKMAATHSDMKQESKYDTRATEAAYLAGAQAKRVYEIIKELDELTSLQLTSGHNKVQVGSLLTLEFNSVSSQYFISPTSGGFLASFENGNYMIIGVHSPIAQASIGLTEGESFEVETPKEIREYTLTKLL